MIWKPDAIKLLTGFVRAGILAVVLACGADAHAQSDDPRVLEERASSLMFQDNVEADKRALEINEKILRPEHPRGAETRRFHDWEVGCDAGRCVAHTVAQEPSTERNVLRIARNRESAYTEWDLDLQLSPALPQDTSLRLVIDDRRTLAASDGIVEIDTWMQGYGHLVPHLQRGRSLSVATLEGDRRHTFSLHGMNAALLWADVQETKARETPKPDAVPEAIRAYAAAHPQCGAGHEQLPAVSQVEKLDARRTIVVVSCPTRSGQGHRTSLLFVKLDLGGGESEDWSPLSLPFHGNGHDPFADNLLSDVAFDPVGRSLTARSSSECGLLATWRLQDGTFRLHGVRTDGGCANIPTVAQPAISVPAPGRDLAVSLRQILAADPECSGEHDTGSENEAIDDHRTLHMLVCGVGAYNGAYRLVLEDRSVPGGARLQLLSLAYYSKDVGLIASRAVINAEYDPKTRTLTHRAKARGMGDCGTQAEWRWTGRRFSLRTMREKDACDGQDDEWPTVFRAQ